MSSNGLVVVGVALFAVGSVLAAAGTSNVGAFVAYIVLIVIGVAVAAYGKKLRDQR